MSGAATGKGNTSRASLGLGCGIKLTVKFPTHQC